MGKRNYAGKMLEKKTVKKKFITVDSSKEEPKHIPYAELSNGCYVEVSEKEIVNVTEEIFAVGDVGK
jgi:hypothetical protein